MTRVQNRKAVVTGGASGIGRAIVDVLVDHGASVAILDTSPAGHDVADDLVRRGHDVMFVPTDVSDEAAVADAMAMIWHRWQELHILVNNAAVSGPAEPTDGVDYGQWQAMMAINVGGPFLCTKHAIPYFRKTTGDRSIVDISSIYGIVGNADSPSYHATKGAVRTMAMTDAVTYAPEGIRVNSVCPGTIMTPLNVAKCEQDPGYLDRMLALHPLGRVGQPVDVAMAVLFLASEESSFVTGAELVVDGGYTAQ